MKFYPIWSRGCEEMASDVQTKWRLYASGSIMRFHFYKKSDNIKALSMRWKRHDNEIMSSYIKYKEWDRKKVMQMTNLSWLNRLCFFKISLNLMRECKTILTRCVCETLMPQKHPSFEKDYPDIWPWPLQMTLVPGDVYRWDVPSYQIWAL